MKTISMSIKVVAMVLAIITIAGNSVAKETAWTLTNVTQGTRVANGSLSANVGDTLKVVFGIEGSDCSSHPSTMRIDSSLVTGVKPLDCESSQGTLTYATIFTAGKVGKETITVWSGGYSWKQDVVITDPYPAPSTFVPRKEYEGHVDDFDTHVKTSHGGPLDSRVQFDLGFTTMPNGDADVAPPRGIAASLYVKVFRHDYERDASIGLKLGAGFSHHWARWWINEALAPTDEEAPVDITTLQLPVLASWRPASWVELNGGGILGARRYFYDSQVLRQGPNPNDPNDQTTEARLLIENNNEQWTPVLGPSLDVRFFPTSFFYLGGGGTALYNTAEVQRTVADLRLEGDNFWTWEGRLFLGFEL